MIIGVTGRIATGKTTLARILEKNGFLRIDADSIYHGLLETSAEMKKELSERFGSHERKSLLSAIQSDTSAISDLNSITHKYVAAEIKRRVLEKDNENYVLDVPVPVKIGFRDIAEYIIVTTCSRDTQLERVIARDCISVSQAELKINMQKESGFYNELGDVVINTDGMTMTDLTKTMEEILDLGP